MDHEETGPEEPAQPDQPDQPDQAAWRRKRRLAEIFGDVLPETTGDERDERDARRPSTDAGEEWLKSQVPPHHG